MKNRPARPGIVIELEKAISERNAALRDLDKWRDKARSSVSLAIANKLLLQIGKLTQERDALKLKVKKLEGQL